MKSMGRPISGTSPLGCLQYLIKREDKDKPGIVIGGNMDYLSSSSPEQQVLHLNRQFIEINRLRPTVKKTVFHNSLREVDGVTHSTDKWIEMCNHYLEKMGLKDDFQHTFVMHDDVDKLGVSHQHVHIISSRISLAGQVYNSSHEGMKSVAIVSDMEDTFGLVKTRSYADVKKERLEQRAKLQAEVDLNAEEKDEDSSIYKAAHEKNKAKPHLTSGEINKADKEKKLPFKAQVSRSIQDAITTLYARSPINVPPTIIELINHLATLKNPIIAVPNMSATTNKFNGLSFFCVDELVSGEGVSFKGSQVGFSQLELAKRGIALSMKGATQDEQDRESIELRKSAISGKQRIADELARLGGLDDKKGTGTSENNDCKPESDFGRSRSTSSRSTSKKAGRNSKSENRKSKGESDTSGGYSEVGKEGATTGQRKGKAKSGLDKLLEQNEDTEDENRSAESTREGCDDLSEKYEDNNDNDGCYDYVFDDDFDSNLHDENVKKLYKDIEYIQGELKRNLNIKVNGLKAKKKLRQLIEDEEFHFLFILRLRQRQSAIDARPVKTTMASSFGISVISIALRLITFGLFKGIFNRDSNASFKRICQEARDLRLAISSERAVQSYKNLVQIKMDIKNKLAREKNVTTEEEQLIRLNISNLQPYNNNKMGKVDDRQ